MSKTFRSWLRTTDNKTLLYLLAVSFWLLLGCLFLAQAYFYTLSTGQQMDWARQAPYRLSGYLVWGLLTIPLWQLFRFMESRFSLNILFMMQLGLAAFLGVLHRLLGTLLEFLVRWLAFNELMSVVVFFETRKIALIGGVLDSTLTYLILLLFFTALSFAFRSQRQQRQFQMVKQELTQSRLDALQSQLQPHFLFNTLNGVVAAIHSQPLKAESMVTQLARILRFSLDNSHQQTVPLKEEFRVLEDYLKIEKARLGERMSFDICIAPQCQLLQVPPLICQPLVENAVRHGIAPFNRAGQIRIDASLESHNKTLRIAIEDSGEPISKIHRNGIGLSNCESRLETLFGQEASLQFGESSLGGTKVELHLPVFSSSMNERHVHSQEHEIL